MRLSELEVLDERRIGSAVSLREIPQKYKGLKVLGRGTTTIALDLDADHVLLLTRDTMKVEWLRDQRLADVVDTFTAQNHIPGMSELDIYVLKCKKLEKLNLENKRLANKLIKEFESKRPYSSDKDDSFRKMYHHFTADEQHRLYDLFSFLSNYDVSQYQWDLGIRNFLQTREGQLVVLDPIVSSEIMDLIRPPRS